MTTSTAPARKGSTTGWIIAVIVVVVLGVAAIAIISRGGDDTSKPTASTSTAIGATVTSAGTTGSTAPAGQPVVTAPVAVAGTPLTKVPSSGDDKAVGATFPTLTGQNVLDGTPVTIANDGRPKLVMFIAHWCPHCQKEVPLIQKWLDDNGKPADVDLYAVSTGVAADRGNYPPAAWLTKVHWSVPTMADSADNTAFVAAGLGGYPSFVVISSDGKVRARTSGELSIAEFTDLLSAARTK